MNIFNYFDLIKFKSNAFLNMSSRYNVCNAHKLKQCITLGLNLTFDCKKGISQSMQKITLHARRKLHLAGLVAWEMR